MDERYSIEVSDDAVLIYGHLSIEEAFDFLNFFDKKGFKSIDLGIESSTLRFRRKSIEESEQEKREEEHKSSEAFYENLYEESKKQVEKLGHKIRQLENFIKELMQTEKEKQARILKEHQANRRMEMLINLKNNPEVEKMMEDFLGGGTVTVVEDFRHLEPDKEPIKTKELTDVYINPNEFYPVKNNFPEVPVTQENDRRDERGESENLLQGNQDERN